MAYRERDGDQITVAITDTQGKASEYMKNKISYSDGPMEEVKVVEDFLPPPEELAFRE